MDNKIVNILIKADINKYVTTTDLIKGEKYNSNMIDLVYTKNLDSNIAPRVYHFEVDSQTKNTFYDVSIFVYRNKIVRTLCDCKQYRKTQSCKHIGACLYHYYDTIFTSTSSVTKSILEKFVKNDIGKVKKKLNFVLNITLEENTDYYYYRKENLLKVKVLIGENKLYTMGNHLKEFMDAYESNEGAVYFGKNFTYDPKNYFLSKEDEEVLRAYNEFVEDSYYTYSNAKKFLNIIKNYKFIFNNYEVDGIIEGFPIDTNLRKEDEEYILEFNLKDIEKLENDDYEYIFYQGKIYHLNKKEIDLIEELEENDMNFIKMSKEEVPLFTKGLLGVIKNNLNIDASVDDIVIPKDIKVKMYFDLKSNHILCNLIFNYDNKELNYFDITDELLRDNEFETKVINELVNYGFKIEKDKIIIDELEKQVDFLENGLERLASNYEVFTTENFKGVSIRKKTNVSSMFKIGKDNILSYNFDLGNIDSSELVNIFKNMKNKNKYYRLKNGDILSLEDESLKELSNLTEELELSDEEIIMGHGNVLKYRAIYLDSLKNTKYNIINTDNLFDEFIKKFYKYKNSELTLSNDELKILRDYQVTGVKWLYNLDKTGFGGILADEMGLGKTIQVIYYIKQMLKENSNYKFLIVVPTSLAYNWDHEFLMYASNIKRCICLGDKHKRINYLNNIKDINVLITTYGLLREDEELYKDINFHGMIIDEAQNIKNNMAGITKTVKKMNADVKIALTGTPLENSVLELWSIFDYIMPGYLSSLPKFQSKYKIKDFDDESEKLIKGLSHQINPFILRRKKEDVIKELPEKLVNDIYIDLLDEQKKIYVAELERVKKEMEEIIENDGISKARFLILQLLIRLRQICITPSIIYEDYKYGSKKIDELKNIINNYIKNNHKILVFSSFKTALNIVKEELLQTGIKTYMIDGSIPAKQRVEMVDKFNNEDDVKVFLIMLKSGGTGLNLTGADVVIHLDLWWNPQAENQATDRAHRIGQKNVVEVIHLIMKGTIEEKILELQNKKRVLSDKIIDGELHNKNIINELTKEDIKNLLSYENE